MFTMAHVILLTGNQVMDLLKEWLFFILFALLIMQRKLKLYS